jgi:hypothetical protein
MDEKTDDDENENEKRKASWSRHTYERDANHTWYGADSLE